MQFEAKCQYCEQTITGPVNQKGWQAAAQQHNEKCAADVRQQRKLLAHTMELVEDVAKAQTTDEAWAASERCYDFLHDLKRNKPAEGSASDLA